MRARVFVGTAFAVALLVAGLLSHYASGSPDGLERVAESTGFLATAQDSFTAGWPLADYAVAGLDNPRLSGGLAGVVGCALTFAFVSMLARRRA